MVKFISKKINLWALEKCILEKSYPTHAHIKRLYLFFQKFLLIDHYLCSFALLLVHEKYPKHVRMHILQKKNTGLYRLDCNIMTGVIISSLRKRKNGRLIWTGKHEIMIILLTIK